MRPQALEAMSSRLAVVALSTGGMQDYGDADRVQILTGVEPVTIANAIATLESDGDRLSSLARAGWRRSQGAGPRSPAPSTPSSMKRETSDTTAIGAAGPSPRIDALTSLNFITAMAGLPAPIARNWMCR